MTEILGDLKPFPSFKFSFDKPSAFLTDRIETRTEPLIWSHEKKNLISGKIKFDRMNIRTDRQSTFSFYKILQKSI